jgi:hypothetical protein
VGGSGSFDRSTSRQIGGHVKHIRVRLVSTALTALVAFTASGRAQAPSDAYLRWSKEQATGVGSAMRRMDNVGNRMSFRGLKTDRAISYKMRATWLTPEVVRATARLIQLNERLSDERTRALVTEADAAGDAVFLIEVDPNEGSGVIPSEWTAVLQPKGAPPGDPTAIQGTLVSALRERRALSGVFRRDYSYDVFWVVFGLRGEAARPFVAPAGRDAELVVNIQGREAVVSWPVPDYVATLAAGGSPLPRPGAGAGAARGGSAGRGRGGAVGGVPSAHRSR